MTKTALACPEDPEPRKGAIPMPSPAYRIGPVAMEKAQACIRAAEMRAKGMKWQDIMAELGLASPLEAKRCAEVGFGLAPGDDLAMARRRAADEIDLLRRELWKMLDNPQPLTGVSGNIVIGADGRPIPDDAIRISAVRAMADLNERYRRLHGTDAPKRNVSLFAQIPPEDLQAEVARLRKEVADAKGALPGEVIRDEGDEPPALPPAT